MDVAHATWLHQHTVCRFLHITCELATQTTSEFYKCTGRAVRGARRVVSADANASTGRCCKGRKGVVLAVVVVILKAILVAAVCNVSHCC